MRSIYMKTLIDTLHGFYHLTKEEKGEFITALIGEFEDTEKDEFLNSKEVVVFFGQYFRKTTPRTRDLIITNLLSQQNSLDGFTDNTDW